ncbi:NAD(P)/FAD-dependent oxidoreductase [Marinimicrobium agarilyticum]|uniref:NAD(P)/FAD-dependent oxidoreductase n=1 Tax=Marinimicrobium agarilyticum TaxID=306546 RepID=UPI00041F8DF2|nr:NAD(P)/FAD-dependent oxidoreductase [Marinimicrobium agarilyticum]
MTEYDVIVIGGGAAGLMCAATAGQRGRRVAVLDHANKVGKKILMSGGGRCNFTNVNVTPEQFISRNPHFCISALRRYTPYDFLDLVHGYDLAYHEKTLGQLFCDHKSRDILDILLAECDKGGVEVRTRCAVETIEQRESGFTLTTTLGGIQCESLVIATGGLSIPTMGATGYGYRVAQQFGLPVTEREAALVPFTLSGHWLEIAQSLSGVSLPVTAECGDQRFAEALLFTHRGLSGPAVLQISNYWHTGEAVTIDLLPTESLEELLEQWRADGQKTTLKNRLSRYLPRRFVETWLELPLFPKAVREKPLAELSRKEMAALCDGFHRWQIVPPGTEGYRTAEVTRGGVDTDAVSSKTFEAKNVSGLYFVGEVLDVTGWLGGYNFQWAWASGYCAGQYV